MIISRTKIEIILNNIGVVTCYVHTSQAKQSAQESSVSAQEWQQEAEEWFLLEEEQRVVISSLFLMKRNLTDN